MGLGLAIVRRLCALLDHPLALASDPGRGSRFSVTLPRIAQHRRRAEPPIHERASEIDSLPASFAGRSVAVVDDDPAVVAAMSTLFASWGARVAGGEDAVSVQRALRGAAPDLIVADLRLAEGGSGIDSIATLRRAHGEATPALIVSGDTGDEALAEARAAGITMLAKPVVASALRLAAERAMAANGTENRRRTGIAIAG